MNETTINLAPTPGAPPEFLCTVTPFSSLIEDLPFEVTLDNYTRDSWGTTLKDSAGIWKTEHLRSVDGKKKLPGFLAFLKQRKKAAFGTFPCPDDDSKKGVMVIPFEQPPAPPSSDPADGDIIYCKYVLDRGLLMKKKKKPNVSGSSGQPQLNASSVPQQKQPPNHNPAPSRSSSSSLKSGMLGNLLGGQRRMHTSLAAVTKASLLKDGTEEGGAGNAVAEGATSVADIIAKFREDTCQTLMDFQRDATKQCKKIKIALHEFQNKLDPADKAGRLSINIDLMKYIVYEQAEELDESWVAAKEPTEFFDECVVAVYKDGFAPQEVLEDLMKGDLPEEAKAEQKAISDAKQKAAAQQEGKMNAMLKQRNKPKPPSSGASSNEMSALNTQKRDRRTLDQIQRDLKVNKRPRVDG